VGKKHGLGKSGRLRARKIGRNGGSRQIVKMIPHPSSLREEEKRHKGAILATRPTREQPTDGIVLKKPPWKKAGKKKGAKGIHERRKETPRINSRNFWEKKKAGKGEGKSRFRRGPNTKPREICGIFEIRPRNRGNQLVAVKTKLFIMNQRLMLGPMKLDGFF